MYDERERMSGEANTRKPSQTILDALAEQRGRLDEMEHALADSLEKKTTIYLDTNHWVHMQAVVLGRPTAKPEYAQLLSLIGNLVKQGVICCPVSSSLFEELMRQSDERTRLPTAKLMDSFSQRVCLQSLLKLARREWRHNVWRVVRGENTARKSPVWTRSGFFAGQDALLLDPTCWKRFSSDAIAAWVDKIWSMGFQDVQALPDFVPIPDKMVAQFVEEMNDPQKREKASLVSFDILRSDEKFSLLESLKDDFFAEPPPSPGKLPTRIFSSFVDEHDPWVLPSLQIYASVYAAVMRSNRRISPHDALDLMHAASAVPYCDAFFCDNAMATFVTSKPLELDKVYDTVVLSRSIEIIDYLQSLTR